MVGAYVRPMNEPPYWPPPPDWRPDPDRPVSKPPANGWGWVIPVIPAIVLSLAAVATAGFSWREAWYRNSFDTTIWLLLLASVILLGSAILLGSGFRPRGVVIALMVTPLWFGFAAFIAVYSLSGYNGQ